MQICNLQCSQEIVQDNYRRSTPTRFLVLCSRQEKIMLLLFILTVGSIKIVSCLILGLSTCVYEWIQIKVKIMKKVLMSFWRRFSKHFTSITMNAQNYKLGRWTLGVLDHAWTPNTAQSVTSHRCRWPGERRNTQSGLHNLTVNDNCCINIKSCGLIFMIN